MYIKRCLALLFLCLPLAHTFPEPSQVYSRSEVLRDDMYRILWQVEGSSITVEVQARTNGWVGFGLSPNGGMPGSDVIIGGVKDGQSYFKDRHASSESMPLEDPSQDYNLLTAIEQGEFTSLTFTRDLVTCDDDDLPILEDTSRVIYAWGDSDPEDELSIPGHTGTNRGSKSIMFLEEMLPSPVITGTNSFNITMDNYQISGNTRTVYDCVIVLAPNLTTKHHIISVAPVIQEGHEQLVHHLIVYPCRGNLAQGVSGHCGNVQGLQCDDKLVFGWAVGQPEFVFPEDAGISIGAQGDPNAFIMQTHYDNPGLVQNLFDSSGLRLVYTEDVRQHDAGVLVLGHSLTGENPIIIPPGAPNFITTGQCSSSCTSQQVPATGLTAFAIFLHTHVVGKSVWTQHVRDGTELNELGRDNHYDFNLQAWRMLKEPATILPGDEFITTCVYNTENKQSMTYSGEGTDNEMCLNFIYYYPATDFGSCLGWGQDTDTLLRFLQNKHDEGVLDMPDLDLSNAGDYLDVFNWTSEYRAEFQSFSHGLYYGEHCVSSSLGGSLFGSGPFQVRRPVVIERPLEKEDVCATRNLETTSISSNTTSGHVKPQPCDTSASPCLTPVSLMSALLAIALLIISNL